jgi:hypothetical protein
MAVRVTVMDVLRVMLMAREGHGERGTLAEWWMRVKGWTRAGGVHSRLVWTKDSGDGCGGFGAVE